MKNNRFIFPVLYVVSLISYFGFYVGNVYPHMHMLETDTLNQIGGWVCLVVCLCIPIELIHRASKQKDKESLLTAVTAVLILVVAAIDSSNLSGDLSKPGSDVIQTLLVRRLALPFTILMFIWAISKALDKGKK